MWIDDNFFIRGIHSVARWTVGGTTNENSSEGRDDKDASKRIEITRVEDISSIHKSAFVI